MIQVGMSFSLFLLNNFKFFEPMGKNKEPRNLFLVHVNYFDVICKKELHMYSLRCAIMNTSKLIIAEFVPANEHSAF